MYYAKSARKAGHKIPGGLNGGGWIALCCAVSGAPKSQTTKAAAKAVLKIRFGDWPATPRQVFADPRAVERAAKYSERVNSDSFLSSFEWRRVRMHALKRDGAKCVCCGATPTTGAQMNVDHIKPRKTHPHLALELDNLQVLCGPCNHGKGNWDSTDWRQGWGTNGS